MSKGQVFFDCLRVDKSSVRLGIPSEHFTLPCTGESFASWHVGYKWGFVVMHGDGSGHAAVLYVVAYDLSDHLERQCFCNLYNSRLPDSFVTGQKSGLLLV